MSWLFWWRPPCLLRRVTVQLKHDETEALEGVLWGSRGPWLTLKQVVALKAGRERESLTGDAVIHRSNVAFLEVLP